MTEQEPTGPYVYQPFGAITNPERAKSGRLFGVGGVDVWTDIKGLTREEAEVVVAALKALAEEGGS